MNHTDLEQSYRRIRSHSDSLFWGTLIILVGATWLGINLGYFDIGIWYDLFKLWPLLLIIWGLNILVRRTPLQLLVYVTPLILAAAFVWVAAGKPMGPTQIEPWWIRPPTLKSLSKSTELTEYNYTVPLEEGVTEVVVELNIGASEARIDTLPSDSTSLAEISYLTSGDEPGVQMTVQDATAYLEAPSAQRHRSGTHARGSGKMDAYLNSNLPTQLVLNVGASALNADLEAVHLESLELSGGAASMDIRLPGAGDEGYQVEINAGTAALELRLPEDAPVYLVSTSALTSTNLSGAGLVRRNGHWESPDFDPEQPHVRIDLTGALSSISIIAES